MDRSGRHGPMASTPPRHVPRDEDGHDPEDQAEQQTLIERETVEVGLQILLGSPVAARRCGAFPCSLGQLRMADAQRHNPPMSSREERMAKNEAASRETNEQAERAHEVDPPGRRIQISCECALKTCGRVISITVDEY